MPARIRKHLSYAWYVLTVLGHLGGRTACECPLCGHRGRFRAFGFPPRYDCLCPECGSLDRHRLLFLCDREFGLFKPEDRVLHFAPEPCLAQFLRPRAAQYRTADIRPGIADLQIDIRDTGLPDGAFDAVLAVHVLEHVEDGPALAELFRILAPGGRLVVMVPLVEGWDSTYENPAIVTPRERDLHFGQWNHVRWYGRDLRQRLVQAGFVLREYCATGADCVRYGLARGEKVLVGTKPGAGAG